MPLHVCRLAFLLFVFVSFFASSWNVACCGRLLREIISLYRPQLDPASPVTRALIAFGVRVAHASGHVRVKFLRSTQRHAVRHARCAPAKPPEDPFMLAQTGASTSAAFCFEKQELMAPTPSTARLQLSDQASLLCLTLILFPTLADTISQLSS